MLVLTEAAAEAVKSVTSTPQAREGAGLRIAASVPQHARLSALTAERYHLEHLGGHRGVLRDPG